MFLNNHTQALLCSWEWCDEKLSTTLNVKESLRVFKNIQLQMFHGLGGFLEYSMFFFRFSSNLHACVPDLSPWFICVSITKHAKWVTHAYEADLCGVFHFRSDLLKAAEHKLFVHHKMHKINRSAGSLDAGTRFGNKHFENTEVVCIQLGSM